MQELHILNRLTQCFFQARAHSTGNEMRDLLLLRFFNDRGRLQALDIEPARSAVSTGHRESGDQRHPDNRRMNSSKVNGVAL